MAEAFLGLKVSVLLHSGIKLEGIVSQIEPSNQQMTLKEVTLSFLGQPPHKTPVYGVVGKDIKDLQVLSPLDNHVLEQLPPPQQQQKILTPTKSTSKSRRLKQQQQQYSNSNGGWAGEDVNVFREEEFDFQKNLDMFDKKRVFAEIRESDETTPEELLVTLNRLPQKVNLLPTEMVLDTFYRAERRMPSLIITATSGMNCNIVTPLQMTHVELECKKMSSLFQELLIENSGRGTALLTLQLTSFQHDKPPLSILILVGNNKNGAIGLITAHHLINHGCLVTVFIITTAGLNQEINKYESMARKLGVKIVYNTTTITTTKYDLIIDSILGSEDIIIQDQHRKAIHWVNNQSCKEILSIDFPSGINSSTGLPHYSQHFIHPKWTICLGAPKTGCKSIHITGELYLLDIGIPKLCWKTIGIKGNTISPWGADFLVALEYSTSK